MNDKKIIILLFLLVLYSNRIYAGSSGTTSLEFIKLPIGSRASAMGGAYCSYGENDSFSIFYNPALSLYVSKIDISLSHTEYLENLRNENINAVFKINNSYSIGIGIIYMYANDFIHTVAAENIEGFSVIGTFGYYDLMAVVNNGFVLSDKIVAGINIKYLQEKIYVESGETVLFDIGVRNREKIFNVLNLGVSLNNMGTPIKFVDKKEKVPLSLRIGLSGGYSPFHLNKKKDDINIAVDLVDEVDYGFKLGLGAEFWAFNMIALRGGYALDFNKSSLSNLTLGLGVKYKMFELGYALVPFDYFGSIHRMSLNVRF